jgi:hypothetical protein
MIPVSGLEDSTALVSGVGRGSLTMANVHPNAHTRDSMMMSATANEKGYHTRIPVNRYVSLAQKYKDIKYDTIMVMDLTSMIADGDLSGASQSIGVYEANPAGTFDSADPPNQVLAPGTTDDSNMPAVVSCAHSHAIRASVTRVAPRESLTTIVNSSTITANVAAMRESWAKSDVVQLVDGYDTFARGEARLPRAIGELIAGAHYNRSYVLNDGFKRTLINFGDLPANPSSAEISDKLQDPATMRMFVDPMDAGMWIGPDDASERMRVLTRDGKNTTFRKWARVVDYLALIAKMDIDYSDRV